MKKQTIISLRFVKWINTIDSHHRQYIALVFSILTFIMLRNTLSFPLLLMTIWLVYTIVNLIFSWITILSSHPIEMSKVAHNQDSSRTFVFIFVIMAAFASLLAVVILLQAKTDLSRQELIAHTVISIACVISSWWLVHTVFTLRYAHFYYCDMDHDKKGKNIKPESLIFPNEAEPDYLDFTYFAFVLGMTFQVSDVQITSRRIRRLAWMHGVLSFAFNTIIVAFTINIISGLIQK